MDMFVDKSTAVLFTDEEIDIICDGIETVFKEFFKDTGTYLAIHGICDIPDEHEVMDHVIHCCNKAPKSMRKITEKSVKSYSYMDFRQLVEKDANRPHFHYNLLTNEKNLLVGSIGLEFDIGMVFAYCSTGRKDKETVRDALYGLTLLICNVLLERSEWAKDLLPKIEASGLVDKITHDLIKKRIDRILHSGSTY